MSKDLITALCQRPGGLEWTTALAARDKLSVQDRQAAPALDPTPPPPSPEGEEPAPLPTPPGLDELVQAAASRLKGEIHYCLEAEKVLLRVVDLPSTDPEEIAGMVEFQVDEVSPFPPERMYHAWEILQQDEKESRVLVAVSSRKQIDEIGEAFRAAGLPPHRIDLDMLCWWYLLDRAKRLPGKGRHLLLFMESQGIDLVLFDEGTPLLFRHLGRQSEEASLRNHMEEVAEEMAYTLTTLEAEWGNAPVLSCTAWYRGDRPEHLDRIEAATGLGVQTENLAGLPPLSEGATLRALRSAETPLLDLAPDTWKEAEALRIARRRLLTGAAIILALWGGLILAVLGYLQFEKMGIQRMQDEGLAQKVPVSEVRELERQVHSLSQFTDRSYSSLECLGEIAEVMPRGVEIVDLTYKKSNGITLRAKCGQQSALIDLRKGLEGAGLFESIDGGQINKSPKGYWEMKVNLLLPQVIGENES